MTSKPKKKFKSDMAADKALKKVHDNMLQQLSLFETTVQLHSIDGLTQLEMENLSNFHNAEVERKHYLLTQVIPGKGVYKGMRLLRRALKSSGQREILNALEKAYEDAVDAIIVEHLQLPEVRPSVQATHNIDASITSIDLSASSLCRDAGFKQNSSHARSTSPSNSDSDDIDNVISLDPSVEYQTQPSYVDVTIHLPFSEGSRTTLPSMSFSVTPHRQRSNHISYKTNPYRAVSEPTKEAVWPLAVKNDSDDRGNNASDTLRSVDQLKCESPIMKFVIVGDSGTGKSSLLRRYISNKFSIALDPTTLLDFQSTEITCYNVKYKLHLWDTAGQERFKAITKAYYRDAVGAFVVYDVNEKNSLEHCIQWKKEIDDVVYLSNGDPIPIVLIANKVDCGRLEGEQFSKDHHFTGYFETSAKRGDGIKEAIHFMVKKVHHLSCTHQEPVMSTLSRDHVTSVVLNFKTAQSDTSSTNGKRCCLHN